MFTSDDHPLYSLIHICSLTHSVYSDGRLVYDPAMSKQRRTAFSQTYLQKSRQASQKEFHAPDVQPLIKRCLLISNPHAVCITYVAPSDSYAFTNTTRPRQKHFMKQTHKAKKSRQSTTSSPPRPLQLTSPCVNRRPLALPTALKALALQVQHNRHRHACRSHAVNTAVSKGSPVDASKGERARRDQSRTVPVLYEKAPQFHCPSLWRRRGAASTLQGVRGWGLVPRSPSGEHE